MVATRRLSALLAAILPRLHLPEPPLALALALSGGADSAALGRLLVAAERPFRCLHVHHGLPASDRLAEAAVAVAGRLGARVEVVGVEVDKAPSPEAGARRVRYQALLEALHGEEVLLTAHTRDDQAETVLLNLLRGTGPLGLAGIPARSGRIARPLLEVARSETRELAFLAGLPFLDDPTNLDLGLRRNLVRLQVLPELSARFNPRLVEALARTAALVSADEEWLAAEAAKVPVLTRDGLVAVAVADLEIRPRPVADRVLRACLVRVRPPYPGTSDELEDVAAVLSGERARARLGGGLEVRRQGPYLVFAPAGEARGQAGRRVIGPGVHEAAGLRIEVTRSPDVCRVAPLGPWAALFPDHVELTLVVGDDGRAVVEADGTAAWIPGERRLPVAWYQGGTPGYLSALAVEETGWTSSH